MYKKIAFHTLGCKLNFSETSTIARSFEQNGFKKVGINQSPDIFVINTCSVTENADKKCKTIVKQALKHSPNAFVIVIGCYAQLKPNEIASIPGVNVVLGAHEKFNVIEYINTHNAKGIAYSTWHKESRVLENKVHYPQHIMYYANKDKAEVHTSEIDIINQFTPSYSIGDRTRSFLKVQDGCNYGCSFCTIPLARGKSRSDSIENIVSSANKIAESGIKEIVLSGVNIGDFRYQKSTGKKNLQRKEEMLTYSNNGIKKQSFYELIQELDKVESIERFRISSIEPNLLTDEIIEFVANSRRFVPHFHIPLQSGCNKILKLMGRRYLRELYAERIKKIKEVISNCCIGTDVIAGFPGETEKDFLDSYNFINQLDISYLHVFTYSERENTKAITIPHAVAMKERNKRSKMLRILSEKKRRYFYEQNVGCKAIVLFEMGNGRIDTVKGTIPINKNIKQTIIPEQRKKYLTGFTENYIRVITKYDPLLINELKTVQLKKIDKNDYMTIS